MAAPRLTLVGGPVSDPGPVPSDADLMARMVAGDQEAFAAVYDRHVDVVFGSVLRFIGDREAAEEIVQDAYLAAWRRAAQYSPGAGTVLGWLLGIARNRSIDRMRAASRRPRLVGLGDAHEGAIDDFERAAAWRAGHGEADPGPETAAVRAWERAVVRSALASMPSTERRPLELAYDEGLTQAEVAVRLGWPLGTVKTRTRRGLATLRTALQSVPELVTTDAPPGGASEAEGAAARQRRTMGGGIGPR